MPASRPPRMKPQKRISSIVVGCRLLEVIEFEGRMMALTEIAKKSHMTPSKAHAYLVSFLDCDVLTQDKVTGFYGLGPFAMRLGAAAMRQSDLISAARETISALREKTGCTVFLSIWGNHGPTIIHKIDGRWTQLPMQVGFVLPVVGSATGNVFIAHLPSEETKPIIAAEMGATPGTKALVESIVRSVRRNGFAGMKVSRLYGGVAAPILRHDGRIAAAITVSRPSENIDAKTRRVLGTSALAAAATLSERLGYRAV